MNRPKLTFGILLTVLGGCFMLTGMVLGIVRLASGSYRDIYSFPISLTQENQSYQHLRFRTKGKIDYTFWLKMPDRKIEHKKFKFSLALVSKDRAQHARFEENFRFGYLRNSAGGGQYYRLGRYRSENEFNGYLLYQSSGKWKPASAGSIVLRRQEKVSAPLKSIGVFSVGLVGLILGIGTLMLNKWSIAVFPRSRQADYSINNHFTPLKNQDSIRN